MAQKLKNQLEKQNHKIDEGKVMLNNNVWLADQSSCIMVITTVITTAIVSYTYNRISKGAFLKQKHFVAQNGQPQHWSN